MDLTPIHDSTMIASSGHDGITTMRIEFFKGTIYEYYGVSVNFYNDFLNSPSKGKFLHDHKQELSNCVKVV